MLHLSLSFWNASDLLSLNADTFRSHISSWLEACRKLSSDPDRLRKQILGALYCVRNACLSDAQRVSILEAVDVLLRECIGIWSMEDIFLLLDVLSKLDVFHRREDAKTAEYTRKLSRLLSDQLGLVTRQTSPDSSHGPCYDSIGMTLFTCQDTTIFGSRFIRKSSSSTDLDSSDAIDVMDFELRDARVDAIWVDKKHDLKLVTCEDFETSPVSGQVLQLRDLLSYEDVEKIFDAIISPMEDPDSCFARVNASKVIMHDILSRFAREDTHPNIRNYLFFFLQLIESPCTAVRIHAFNLLVNTSLHAGALLKNSCSSWSCTSFLLEMFAECLRSLVDHAETQPAVWLAAFQTMLLFGFENGVPNFEILLMFPLPAFVTMLKTIGRFSVGAQRVLSSLVRKKLFPIFDACNRFAAYSSGSLTTIGDIDHLGYLLWSSACSLSSQIDLFVCFFRTALMDHVDERDEEAMTTLLLHLHSTDFPRYSRWLVGQKYSNLLVSSLQSQLLNTADATTQRLFQILIERLCNIPLKKAIDCESMHLSYTESYEHLRLNLETKALNKDSTSLMQRLIDHVYCAVAEQSLQATHFDELKRASCSESVGRMLRSICSIFVTTETREISLLLQLLYVLFDIFAYVRSDVRSLSSRLRASASFSSSRRETSPSPSSSSSNDVKKNLISSVPERFPSPNLNQPFVAGRFCPDSLIQLFLRGRITLSRSLLQHIPMDFLRTCLETLLPFDEYSSEVEAVLFLLVESSREENRLYELGGSSYFKQLLLYPDATVAYHASRFMLEQLVTQKPERYRDLLPDVMHEAQLTGNENLLDNPYLQIKFITKLLRARVESKSDDPVHSRSLSAF